MYSNSFDNETLPIFQGAVYEVQPIGHFISFPSFWDFKKIKNFNKNISRFLERGREKYDDIDENLKCLELIENLIEDFDVHDIKEDYSYKVDFPSVIEVINKVGFLHKDKSNRVKLKHNLITLKLQSKHMAI